MPDARNTAPMTTRKTRVMIKTALSFMACPDEDYMFRNSMPNKFAILHWELGECEFQTGPLLNVDINKAIFVSSLLKF